MGSQSQYLARRSRPNKHLKLVRRFDMLRSLGADELVDYTREAIAVLRELLESGKVTPIIDSTFQLSEVREAFRRMIEDEIQGKVIITPAERV